MQDKDQTRWLIEYLDTRLSKLEDRLDSISRRTEDRIELSIQKTEDKLSESLGMHVARLERLEENLNLLEEGHLKLASQAGFLKNLLAFIGTAVLSLAGWAASTFFMKGN